jgi:hypothetical protein
MSLSKIKKPVILGILFFLPVIFLLFLYPSTHNYTSLDVVNENIEEITSLLSVNDRDLDFQDNITVLAFLGKDPMLNAVSALNLKELIYNKFKGFKRFQIIALVHEKSEEKTLDLQKELYKHDELDYWHFVYGADKEIERIYNSLLTKNALNANLASDEVFIIDKDRHQRGRWDDRTDNEMARNDSIYGLYSYNCIEVAELKNKMSEDMRILFTEYRQKRKGNYNSSSRRSEDINTNEKN